MNLLIQEFLTQILPADEPSVLEPLLKMARPRHFHKKELLLAEGETPTEIIFIQKGIFRGFFYNVSGKDVTDCFCYRFGEPAVPSLPLDAPANVSMEALTESETVSFPAAPLVEFLSRSSFALR
ncbi:MAG TPA: cyclic nucleotide-binding domain-containing protein, partial [Candidatus Caccousia avistercoris]|nr:cyclic nucleotide-binding domain-containing protein [Candidatus Caccousia avistercoris]